MAYTPPALSLPPPPPPRPNRVAFVQCDYCKGDFDPLAHSMKCPNCGAPKTGKASVIFGPNNNPPSQPPPVRRWQGPAPTNNPGTR